MFRPHVYSVGPRLGPWYGVREADAPFRMATFFAAQGAGWSGRPPTSPSRVIDVIETPPAMQGEQRTERMASVNWVDLRTSYETAPAIGSPTVLIVESDLQTRTKYARALGDVGFRIETANSAASAVTVARSRRVDFMLIGPQITTDDVVGAVRDVANRDRPYQTPQFEERATPPAAQTPRSVAERWAMLVIQACRSDGDLKTLADWAAFVGVSYSSLCEACRLVNVRPRDARDLARVLCAIVGASRDRLDPGLLLDVRDRRTLRALLTKAGIYAKAGVSVEQFLNSQQFVAAHNVGLIALRRFLAASIPPGDESEHDAWARSPAARR